VKARLALRKREVLHTRDGSGGFGPYCSIVGGSKVEGAPDDTVRAVRPGGRARSRAAHGVLMTISSPNPPLVVGIDGSEHGLQALDWAAATAAARHWPLRLINIFQPFVAGTSSAPLMFNTIDPEGVSEQYVKEAQQRLEQHWPLVESTNVSRVGSTIPALLDELATGRMLVVGRRGVGRFTALLAGSTALACAARAHGPVVIVPPTYVTGPTDGRVVVGVDGSDRGEAAVEMAFAEASARGRSLDVVHAWALPSPYGFDFAGYNGPAAWKVEQELGVAEVTAGWAEKYPDVEVRTFVEADHPAAALVRRAAGADLLVVGGRGHSALVGKLLGSITSAVIQHATSPVLVVHGDDHDVTR
jgi:nucleotide-binding universal stress UspA family protein